MEGDGAAAFIHYAAHFFGKRDGRRNRKRVGIEDHQGEAAAIFLVNRETERLVVGIQHPFAQGVHVPGDLLQGGVQVPGRNAEGFAVEFANIVVGFLDGTAAHNVVELVEQHVVPGVLQIAGGIGQAEFGGGNGRKFFRHQQAIFRAAVGFLHRAVGAVAADGVVLQIAMHHFFRAFAGVYAGQKILPGTPASARHIFGSIGAAYGWLPGWGRPPWLPTP